MRNLVDNSERHNDLVALAKAYRAYLRAEQQVLSKHPKSGPECVKNLKTLIEVSEKHQQTKILAQ